MPNKKQNFVSKIQYKLTLSALLRSGKSIKDEFKQNEYNNIVNLFIQEKNLERLYLTLYNDLGVDSTIIEKEEIQYIKDRFSLPIGFSCFKTFVDPKFAFNSDDKHILCFQAFNLAKFDHFSAFGRPLRYATLIFREIYDVKEGAIKPCLTIELGVNWEIFHKSNIEIKAIINFIVKKYSSKKIDINTTQSPCVLFIPWENKHELHSVIKSIKDINFTYLC